MTVWDTLSGINQRLETDIQELLRLISEIDTPDELLDYRQHLTNLCTQLAAHVKRNHIYIQLNRTEMLDDVVAVTRFVYDYIKLANQYLATPISRSSTSDRLCLFVIRWMHNLHDQTRKYPSAFIEGDPAIIPFVERPPTPIYYFPFSKQRGLLYQSLLFHEFGHLLYAVHEPEMKDLVEELQRKISHRLAPLSQRNDRYSREQANYRQSIVYTWFKWIQELFCDAVGFIVGGPCYVHAFSAYLSSVNEISFYRSPDYLEDSKHPVTWLRVQLLTDRVEMYGYQDLAHKTRQIWEDVARLLNIREDYHGYYHPSLKDDIRVTIDEMLIEAAPRSHTQEEAAAHSWSPETETPVHLLNWAWKIFLNEPQSYSEWEKEQINQLLTPTALEE